MLSGELEASIGPLISATEGGLHGVYSRNFKFLPHCNASSCLFALVDSKPGAFEREAVADFRHYEGEEPSGLRVLEVIISVHEDVLVSTVPVEIAVEH